jgi:hypothetical protein
MMVQAAYHAQLMIKIAILAIKILHVCNAILDIILMLQQTYVH